MRNVIGIVAGKGGVGKSTVSVNLALALKKLGFNVGLLDADIYGPSLRKMLQCAILPSQNPEQPERILPAVSLGIKLVSMSFFMPDEEAAVVRAPIANAVIGQFLHQVDWGDLDYLLIDFPPGTGDIQLTLMQQGKLDGALIVTTPQEVALLDVRKAVRMLQQLKVPVLGVVENMSCFLGHYPFGKGGGARLAEEIGAPLFGEVPIDPLLSRCADAGESVFDVDSDSEGAKVFCSLAERLVSCRSAGGAESEAAAHFSDEKTLKISWKDGLERFLDLGLVQRHCPCVRCRESSPAVDQVEGAGLELVGRYAIKIVFSSGCSRGIYPFSLLRRLSVHG